MRQQAPLPRVCAFKPIQLAIMVLSSGTHPPRPQDMVVSREGMKVDLELHASDHE